MIRGIYTAASAMLVQMGLQDVVGNNLANANTTAYKRDEVSFKARMDKTMYRVDMAPGGPVEGRALVGQLSTGAEVSEIRPNLAQGELRPTDNPLDLGLRGRGFFLLEEAGGQQFLARAGTFMVDRDRYLVDGSGARVLGEEGPLLMPQAGTIKISQDGVVTVGSKLVGRLALREVERPVEQLEKVGVGRFRLKSGELRASGSEVHQGYLEASDVSPTHEMVKMVTAMRSYESSQKAMQTHDELLGKAVNELGKV
ncbi:MAG: flagellar hook-basal body protein [Candidatus Sericytochromatia bacterium]|nr:flagellar hook-basal body protein [Candidatus Sericytochromatia bacterium]